MSYLVANPKDRFSGDDAHNNSYKTELHDILREVHKLYQLMRLWHLSPSVVSIFKRACAAIKWGYTSDFWSDPSSTSIVHVCEQRRLWRDCANAQGMRRLA